MESTPFQIVGCVFSLEPDAQRIDDFVTQARRERAVATTKNPRQATVVKVGATDARLIVLACRTAQGAGSSLRFGFDCSLSGGPRAADGVRVSARSVALAGDLAAGARDGEVLLSPQLAARLAATGFECKTREVHLPGGRVAVACTLDAPSADSAPVALDDTRPQLVEPRVETESRQEALDDRLARIDERLAQFTAQAATLAQTLEQAQQAMTTLEQGLARCRSEQQSVLDHAERMNDLRARIEETLARVADTDGKLASIESRRPVVEEVQSRAEDITHMLQDMQVHLEMLGAQRAVVDDVGGKLARLEFTVQEAHNTLRALQRERELAERVEQGIKALRARGPAKANA